MIQILHFLKTDMWMILSLIFTFNDISKLHKITFISTFFIHKCSSLAFHCKNKTIYPFKIVHLPPCQLWYFCSLMCWQMTTICWVHNDKKRAKKWKYGIFFDILTKNEILKSQTWYRHFKIGSTVDPVSLLGVNIIIIIKKKGIFCRGKNT